MTPGKSYHSTNKAYAEFAAFDAAPGEPLGESVNLIVVATGKSKQFRGELLKPSRAAGKTNRAAGKQVRLGDHA
jgi:hypothetical protein